MVSRSTGEIAVRSRVSSLMTVGVTKSSNQSTTYTVLAHAVCCLDTRIVAGRRQLSRQSARQSSEEVSSGNYSWPEAVVLGALQEKTSPSRTSRQLRRVIGSVLPPAISDNWSGRDLRRSIIVITIDALRDGVCSVPSDDAPSTVEAVLSRCRCRRAVGPTSSLIYSTKHAPACRSLALPPAAAAVISE
ncbi:hypothetical protein LSAT2_024794 [Lamellibrachia satsuma]|nr:hypothetical protein LSAT2_024794 [Lamellibrachia satsuma]